MSIGFYPYNSLEVFLIAHRSPQNPRWSRILAFGEKFLRPRSKMK